MLPERVPRFLIGRAYPGGWDSPEARAFCDWRDRWVLDVNLALKVTQLQHELGVPLNIISGYRSDDEQRKLIAAGEATLAPEKSNHCACPSRAADLWPAGVTPNKEFKLQFGRAARVVGLRWGGGAPVDADGIPTAGEWNHVDLGPRHP